MKSASSIKFDYYYYKHEQLSPNSLLSVFNGIMYKTNQFYREYGDYLRKTIWISHTPFNGTCNTAYSW